MEQQLEQLVTAAEQAIKAADNLQSLDQVIPIPRQLHLGRRRLPIPAQHQLA